MRSEIIGYRGHVVTFVAAVAFAVGAFLYFLGLGGGLPSTHDSYRVNALLPGSGTLTAGARVTMAGAKVGKVVSVRRQGLAALVSMELDDERVTPIPSDTHIHLRQRTPVGENYVTLTPGRSHSSVRDGGVLP